jgi:hypothetical protein
MPASEIEQFHAAEFPGAHPLPGPGSALFLSSSQLLARFRPAIPYEEETESQRHIILLCLQTRGPDTIYRKCLESGRMYTVSDDPRMELPRRASYALVVDAFVLSSNT